jgi:thiol-disulfide isomerase/thioredoxin
VNRDNFSALLTGIAVVALIVGFAIYFNNPKINTSSFGNSGDNFIPSVSVDNKTGQIIKSQYAIDKSQFKKAPEFEGITGSINTKPLHLSDLRGKVVLVDFWTYSCINCIRTIPYLVDWDEKYSDKGLVIVGIHTPEFEFEKDIHNVQAAVKKFGIKYPVLQDNDKATWNAYKNLYWPRKYIVDSEGYIRYDHIGEGGYQETEKIIQNLLAERAAQQGIKGISFNQNLIKAPLATEGVDFSRIITPEIYLGYDLARAPLGSKEGFHPAEIVNYSIPKLDLEPNTVYVQGQWKNNPDNLELAGDSGKIVLLYSAKSANIVAGGNGSATITNDPSGVNGSIGTSQGESAGKDLTGNKLVIDGQRLYNISQHDNYGNHYVIINAQGKGFQIYTFTFG